MCSHSEDMVRILNDEINARLRESDSIVGGSSILPGSSGIVVRMLGHLAGDIRMRYLKF